MERENMTKGTDRASNRRSDVGKVKRDAKRMIPVISITRLHKSREPTKGTFLKPSSIFFGSFTGNGHSPASNLLDHLKLRTDKTRRTRPTISDK